MGPWEFSALVAAGCTEKLFDLVNVDVRNERAVLRFDAPDVKDYDVAVTFPLEEIRTHGPESFLVSDTITHVELQFEKVRRLESHKTTASAD